MTRRWKASCGSLQEWRISMIYLEHPFHGLEQAVEETEALDEKVFLVAVGEKALGSLPDIVHRMDETGVEFFGGIFPGLIVNSEVFDHGILLHAFPRLSSPWLIRDLNQKSPMLPSFEIEQPPLGYDKHTVWILVDGLANHISDLFSRLHDCLSDSVRYFGGGTGSASLERKPCIFSNEGIFQDAALVVPIQASCTLGAHHGWSTLAGPIFATKTRGNIIDELNWQNAFEVYQRAVGEASEEELDREQFHELATKYPFAMLRQRSESILRDPLIVTPSGDLVCSGGVPENTPLSIMKGDRNSLNQAARSAIRDCFDWSTSPVDQVIVSVSHSRAGYLKQRFSEELEAIRRKVSTLDHVHGYSGFLSLGEIACRGGRLDLLNKTFSLMATRRAEGSFR